MAAMAVLGAAVCGFDVGRIGAAQITDQSPNGAVVPQGAGGVASGLTAAAVRSTAAEAEAEADRGEYADDGIGKFWAIYNRYTDQLRQINDEKYRLVQDYGKEWGGMTNDQALV